MTRNARKTWGFITMALAITGAVILVAVPGIFGLTWAVLMGKAGTRDATGTAVAALTDQVKKA